MPKEQRERSMSESIGVCWLALISISNPMYNMPFSNKTSEIIEWFWASSPAFNVFFVCYRSCSVLTYSTFSYIEPKKYKINDLVLNCTAYCRFLLTTLVWILWNWSFTDRLRDDTLWYFLFTPIFSRSPPFGVPGARGEGRRLRLARGFGASRGAGAAPPSPSFFPECRAHPGAEGERERPGEGRRLLICTSKAANRLWRSKNVKQTVPDLWLV